MTELLDLFLDADAKRRASADVAQLHRERATEARRLERQAAWTQRQPAPASAGATEAKEMK